jgi:hypothetical protein
MGMYTSWDFGVGMQRALLSLCTFHTYLYLLPRANMKVDLLSL